VLLCTSVTDRACTSRHLQSFPTRRSSDLAGAKRYATSFRGGLYFFQQRLKPRLDANLLAGFVSPRRANTQRRFELITCTLGHMLPNHLENNLSSRTLIRIMGPVFLVIRCPCRVG